MRGLRREYPDVPLVGVGGVLLEDNKILLIRRKNEPGKGLWSIPGGLVRLGERLDEAVEREVSEETGLRVAAERPIYAFDYVEVDGEGRVRYHYVIVDYLCRRVGGSLRPGGDAKEVRWTRLEDSLHLMLTDGTRKLIEEIRKPFSLVIKNRDVKKVLIGVPEGHKHARTVIVLRDGSKLILQEATMENLARAAVEVEMHPLRRAISLSARELGGEERKEGYDRYQLLEDDRPEEDIIREITTEVLGSVGPAGGEERPGGWTEG